MDGLYYWTFINLNDKWIANFCETLDYWTQLFCQIGQITLIFIRILKCKDLMLSVS